MNLMEYFGHKIELITKENKSFIGWVSDYFPPEENENNEESIALETPAIEFNINEIKSIKVLV